MKRITKMSFVILALAAASRPTPTCAADIALDGTMPNERVLTLLVSAVGAGAEGQSWSDLSAFAVDAPAVPQAVPVESPLTQQQIAALCQQVLAIFNGMDLGTLPQTVKNLESATCTDCSGPALQSTVVEWLRFKLEIPPLTVHKDGWLVGGILADSDYQGMLEERPVLIIGEEHEEWAARELIHANLAKMRATGVTYLAIEGQGFFEQPLFDAYFDTGSEAAWAKLKSHLADNIKGPKKHLEAIFPLARALGMRVVGIDIPGPVAECLHMQAGDSVSSPVLQVLGYRDRWMAARIRQILDREPQAKLVALVGQVHTGRHALPLYLKALGIPAHSLLININPHRADSIKYTLPEAEASPTAP